VTHEKHPAPAWALQVFGRQRISKLLGVEAPAFVLNCDLKKIVGHPESNPYLFAAIFAVTVVHGIRKSLANCQTDRKLIACAIAPGSKHADNFFTDPVGFCEIAGNYSFVPLSELLPPPAYLFTGEVIHLTTWHGIFSLFRVIIEVLSSAEWPPDIIFEK
jgi:hypothetical protein